MWVLESVAVLCSQFLASANINSVKIIPSWSRLLISIQISKEVWSPHLTNVSNVVAATCHFPKSNLVILQLSIVNWIDLHFKKAFQIKTYISTAMHEDTITTVVIVVMVIQIWRIKSKFWAHLDSCVNNGTWLSFSKIWITPILSTGPFERLHSKVKQITSPRPDLIVKRTSFSWSYFAPSQKCQPDSAMRVSTFACSYLARIFELFKKCDVMRPIAWVWYKFGSF